MTARKAVMSILCAHIYVLSIKLRCENFNRNNTDLKKNIFNTVGFIDCIKLLRYQIRLYHRTKKSIHSSALFLFLLLACGDNEVNPGPGQAGKGFCIYEQNLRGLWNNKEVLEHFINMKSIKIFGITETLLSSSIPHSFLQIRGYAFERKDRVKAGGGIAVYIKEGVIYLRQNYLECDEIEAIWLEIMVDCNLDSKNNVSIKDLFEVRGYKQIIKTATGIAKDSSTLTDVILGHCI